MRPYIIVTIGKALSAVAQMVLIAILAIELSPNELAPILAVYSLASIIAAIGDMGLGTLAMRDKAYGKAATAHEAVRLANLIAWALGITGATLLFGISLWFPVLLVTTPILLWAAIERATETRNLYLIANEQFGRAAVLAAGRRIAALIIFFPVSLAVGAAWGFSISLTASSLVAFCLAVHWTKFEGSQIRVSRIGLLRQAWPLAMTSVAGQLRNIDVPIIAIFVGGAPAAAYGLGARFASPAMLVFSSISNVLLVRVRYLARSKVNTGIILGLLATVAVAIVMNLMRPVIEIILSPHITWLTGSLMQIVLNVGVSYLFAGFCIVLGTLCVAFGMQIQLMRINLIAVFMILAIAATLAAVTHSAYAVSIAMIVCYLVQMIAITVLLIKSQKGN